VITGVAQTDPLSVRAARMKVYMRFMAELDADGKVSGNLSEIDLSNPEDVKALIPGAGTTDILVHFGEEDFRHRYDLYEKHLPEWLAAHPRLAAADMRYEHQVVLEMQPGAAVASEMAAEKAPEIAPPVAPVKAPPSVKAKAVIAKPVVKSVLAQPKPTLAVAPRVPDAAPAPAKPHLQTAFDVKPKAAPAKTTTQVSPQ
jgi:cell division protein FtsQ